MYAVVRIRGMVNVSPDKKKVLEYLNLRRTNNLSFWKESADNLAMIKTAEGFVTYGVVTEDFLEKVILAKGKAKEGMDLKKAIAELKKGKTLREAGIRNCFRLSPPRKGFEREGTKKDFKVGGALGNRGKEIVELIERMM